MTCTRCGSDVDPLEVFPGVVSSAAATVRALRPVAGGAA